MQPLPYADPGVSDVRGPGHYLIWVARGQWRIIVASLVPVALWMLAQAVTPTVVGLAIDEGIVPRDWQRLTLWCLVIVGLAAVSAVFGSWGHWLSVHSWLRAAFRTIQLTHRRAALAGPALPRRIPTGEVVANVSSDMDRIGSVMESLGRVFAAVLSYAVVGVILLSKSLQLGLLVLIGVPVLVATLGLVLRPLQARQAAQREESGRLTTLGSDTVSGLRVLSGIGGEETFLRRYEAQSQVVLQHGRRVAPVQAALEAARILLPGVFVVIVTWAGARMVVAGQLQPGELVAFYGTAIFLVMPLRSLIFFTDRLVKAWIAARKTIAIHGTRSDDETLGQVGSTAAAPERPAELHDPVSGLTVAPGRLTALVSERPEQSAQIVDRLGRFGPDATPVTWGGRPLSVIPLDEVRHRIMVVENDSHLFTGTLREGLDVRGDHRDDDVLAAIHIASAEDVLDALPDGLDSVVAERGRSFSGGQRQRLVLTRALLLDPEVLLLLEPTSAVDAHTEARIADRLARSRRDRTTVLATVSPLLLDRADVVVLLEEGRVVATGSHHELMNHPAYRRVVVRGEEDEQ